MTKQAETYPTFRQSIWLLLLMILAGQSTYIAFRIVTAQFGIPIPKTGKIYESYFTFGYIFVFLIVFVYAIRRKRRVEGPGKTLSFNKVAPMIFVLISVAFVFQTMLEEELYKILPKMPASVYDDFVRMQSMSLSTVVSVVIIGPVCEEILFRGIILDGFLKRFHAPAAIILSSFLFGFMHLNIWQGIPAFSGALFSGWIYYKTRSVLPCIFLHFLWNLSAVLVTYYTGGVEINMEKITGVYLYYSLVFFSGIGFLITIYFLNKKFRQPPAIQLNI